MDSRTKLSIATAIEFANVLMYDEHQDRQLVIEGQIEMLEDIRDHDGRMTKDLARYVARYSSLMGEEISQAVARINQAAEDRDK